jgi:RNA polymerase sigma-70 factor, ECF subfamily
VVRAFFFNNFFIDLQIHSAFLTAVFAGARRLFPRGRAINDVYESAASPCIATCDFVSCGALISLKVARPIRLTLRPAGGIVALEWSVTDGRRKPAGRRVGKNFPSRENSGNFSILSTSKPMSSVSGTHDEAEFRPDTVGRAPRPDVALLQRAQRGDRAAYGQIVVLYQDRLYNAVLRLVGDRDEALELTQEAFTRGLANLKSFRGDASPYTWLFRIAVNLAISQLRKVQRQRTFSLDHAPANGRHHDSDDQASGLVDRVAQDRSETPPQRVERREREQAVLAALGRLDAEYRAVLVMRDIEGFDYQQMADVLSLPLGTLKSRLFRARLALRDELRTYIK